MLLRRGGRSGFFRRSVFVGALAGMLLLAPGAAGVPGPGEPPAIAPVIFGTLGANGWYVTNVTVNWKIETHPDWPPLETIGCEARTLTADTLGTTLECRARNDKFDPAPPYDWSISTKTFKIDKTVPAVTTVLERPPDANGWYNRPLSVAFVGTDATSTISSCTSGRYAGPDTTAGLIAGSCTDNAGNHAPASFAFKYDATPPSIFAVTAVHGNRSAQISWRKSSDTKLVEVFRTPGRNGQGESGIYRGSATGTKDTGLVVGRKYEYRVIGVDEAANRAEKKFSLVATGALLSPTPGLRITSKSPPILVWAPARKATYYNLQLIRAGRKVLSAWPTRPSYRLRRAWLYKGRRYRLQPGVYRWYVWPGYGRISAADYAKRPLGSSTFVVTK
jgi:hypothetical protein